MNSDNSSNNPARESFDVIIIGSGMGGLALASLLTRLLKKRVLILEKHGKLGGFTHSFGRKKRWRWDVGIHYLGDLAPGSSLQKIFAFLTGNKMQWQKFPSVFQYYCYPNLKVPVSSDANAFKNTLYELFPEESLALEKYFKDIKKAPALWGEQLFRGIFAPKPKNAYENPLLTMSTKEYLQKNFRNKKLMAVLDSQWGDMGLPPAKNPFYLHAMLVGHYLNGAYYPKDGAHKIAESIMATISPYGSEGRTYAKVTEVLHKIPEGAGPNARPQVYGCRYLDTKDKQQIWREVYAPLIISNAGARLTYSQWIADALPSLKTQINKIPPGLSAITVYIGLKEHPKKIAIQGENFWIYSDFDHDAMAENSANLLDGKPLAAFVSFGSCHNQDVEHATAQILTFVSPNCFAQWQDTTWQKRGDDYNNLKNKISEALVNFVEQTLPGFKDLVEFTEVGTPLSVKHYSDQPFGEIYGLPRTSEHHSLIKELGPETPIAGFYLTGVDVGAPGIAGAITGAILTFLTILNKNKFDFIKAIINYFWLRLKENST